MSAAAGAVVLSQQHWQDRLLPRSPPTHPCQQQHWHRAGSHGGCNQRSSAVRSGAGRTGCRLAAYRLHQGVSHQVLERHRRFNLQVAELHLAVTLASMLGDIIQSHLSRHRCYSFVRGHGTIMLFSWCWHQPPCGGVLTPMPWKPLNSSTWCSGEDAGVGGGRS
ncbi:hypothetical protein COO60DRAFT_1509625 [Scenedesmus sp. NREL 46B-D3]|nr:hypothetical protein COO60DRAFT_1509625 [Scenedesmus sp. NREL 46B-D3]